MAFLGGLGRLGANALSEGMEESIQEAAGIFTEYLAKSYANTFQGGTFDHELFTGEHAAQIGEAFKGGAVVGAWLGSGPIVVSTAIDVRSGRMAQAYSENLMALYDKVEVSSTRRLSPAHMQSALEFSGEAMRESVALPADAALELYQKGTDILSPLGITEEQAMEAAAQGRDFLVPVAKLPAYLDRQQMEAATQILRCAPDALSAADAAANATAIRLNERNDQTRAELAEARSDGKLFRATCHKVDGRVYLPPTHLADAYKGSARVLDAHPAGCGDCGNWY